MKNKYTIELSGNGIDIIIGLLSDQDLKKVKQNLSNNISAIDTIINEEIDKRCQILLKEKSLIIDKFFNINIYENENLIKTINDDQLYDDNYKCLNFNYLSYDNSDNIFIKKENLKLTITTELFDYKFNLSKLKININEDIEVENIFYHDNLISSIDYNKIKLNLRIKSCENLDISNYMNY